MKRITHLLLGLAAAAGASGACFAEPGAVVVVREDGTRVECRTDRASAVTEIGSVAPGTKIQGSVRRTVRTGSRVTVASSGPGRSTCVSGDPALVSELLEELAEDL